MTLTILGIIGSLLGLLFFLVKRRCAKNDNPQEQLKKAYREIDQAISKGDAGVADINRMVADMERMSDAGGDNPGEQGNQVRRNELHSSPSSDANPIAQPNQENDFRKTERITNEPSAI